MAEKSKKQQSIEKMSQPSTEETVVIDNAPQEPVQQQLLNSDEERKAEFEMLKAVHADLREGDPSMDKRAKEWVKKLESNDFSQNADFLEVYNAVLDKDEVFNGYNLADDTRRKEEFLNHFKQTKTKA